MKTKADASKILCTVALVVLSALPAAALFSEKVEAAGNFTIVVLPDTQRYAATYPAIFNSQTNWIKNNKTYRNIVFVTQEGDITDSNSINNWENANTAMSKLDGVVPYGIAPGNHDQAPDNTALFNTYFPYTRFQANPWYGGHAGTDNDNSYQLFSGGGQDFIILHIEFGADSDVLSWADSILKNYPQRKAILTSHYLLRTDGSFGTFGNNLYNELKDNPNLFLMLCGHMHSEARRSDTYNGNTIHTLLSDYQTRTNGGDGWLRLLEFNPTSKVLTVKTFSPTLSRYETDADSQFQITYDVPAVPALLSPSNNATVISSNIIFRWSAPYGATKFHLTVTRASDNSTFFSQELGRVTFCTVTGFPNDGTQFRWCVSAGNSAGWSAFSSQRTVNSGRLIVIPAVPLLYSPANNATVNGSNITFRWSAPYGATKYRLTVTKVSDDSTFFSQELGKVTYYTVTGFPNDGTQFRWCVSAGNSAGWSADSIQRTVNSGRPIVIPAVPVLYSPANNATLTTTSITFRWSAPYGATNYRLTVTNAADNSTFFSQELGKVTYYTVSGFPNDGTQFRWCVSAGNSAGWSADSSQRTINSGRP